VLAVLAVPSIVRHYAAAAAYPVHRRALDEPVSAMTNPLSAQRGSGVQQVMPHPRVCGAMRTHVHG